jgi:copper ion binding protein
MIDQPRQQRENVSVTLEISGMHCSSCSALIEEALGDVAGVSSVHVSLTQASGKVSFDAEDVTEQELCAVVRDLGYAVSVKARSLTDDHSS